MVTIKQEKPGRIKSGRSAAGRAVLVLCAAMPMTLPAQTFTSLHSFSGTGGQFPESALVQGFNGDFYGTTDEGGANSQGTVFKITPAGKLTSLYSFCAQSGCPDGADPQGGLAVGSNGDFYGTTYNGGTNGGWGTVYKIAPSGALTTIYKFCAQFPCADGQNPEGGLVLGADGNFYGTTYEGGTHGGYGTVFKITPSGALTTIYSFCALVGCTDGEFPMAALTPDANGVFYGTTSKGGAYGYGTVFSVTSSGVLTTLYSFCSLSGCSDGEYPQTALVQGTDGNLYGTTLEGGISLYNGTVFRVTPEGMLTTIYSFCPQSGCPDGNLPNGLIQATNGDLYGATFAGGVYGLGSVYQITTSGALTTMYSFCPIAGQCPDGLHPDAPLFQGTNGNLYGTTYEGGKSTPCKYSLGCGTVFSLSLGLTPFVETLPTSGRVGAAVKILGNNLSGATAVTFNGTPAAFKVVSSFEITTTVPAGASTACWR